jgi:Uma2 family endonuclease
MSMPLLSSTEPQPAWGIATLFPAQGSWSIEDYLDLTDSTNRLVEFTNGKVEVLQMPTMTHQLILDYVFTLMKAFVNERSLGRVLFAALRVQVDEAKFREPDIVYISRERREHAQDRYWTAADLVVEIVSDDPESRKRDLVTKRADYAAAGISEYWIVDPQEKRITVLALDGARYAVHGEFAPGQQATSKLLEGFAVDVAGTFAAAKGEF